MTTWLAYGLGVLLHVASRWAGWKGLRPSAKWKDYWKLNGALNIQSAIASIVCAFMWEQGWVSTGINQLMTTIWPGIVPLRVTVLSSIFAGYTMDSIGRTLLALFVKRSGGEPAAKEGV